MGPASGWLPINIFKGDLEDIGLGGVGLAWEQGVKRNQGKMFIKLEFVFPGPQTWPSANNME